MEEEEIWAAIEGFEDYYEVSNIGRVKSVSREVQTVNGYGMKIKERILKSRFSKRGYEYLGLWKEGNSSTLLVHRLVAETFRKHIDISDLKVIHIDGCISNNRSENLKWGTQKDVIEIAIRNGSMDTKGENHGSAKITDYEKAEIIEKVLDKKQNKRDTAKAYGISYSRVYQIVREYQNIMENPN